MVLSCPAAPLVSSNGRNGFEPKHLVSRLTKNWKIITPVMCPSASSQKQPSACMLHASLWKHVVRLTFGEMTYMLKDSLGKAPKSCCACRATSTGIRDNPTKAAASRLHYNVHRW
mmetsp:Transcript_28060/g.81116  ORF Transcript_28060/g.81116 Transcript_28060/m.81116 type:complete len:115 (-) Transcript_28060:451-795(-)